ncbi:unnamed protein product [Musa textilis]
MVFNAGWVTAVARASAEACQYVACNPERLSSEEVLDLLCCLPLRHLRRLAICVFSFFCVPPSLPDEPRIRGRRYAYRYSLSSSSASSSSSDEYDSAGAGRTICVRPEYFVRACFIDLDLESLEKMVYCHELDQE